MFFRIGIRGIPRISRCVLRQRGSAAIAGCTIPLFHPFDQITSTVRTRESNQNWQPDTAWLLLHVSVSHNLRSVCPLFHSVFYYSTSASEMQVFFVKRSIFFGERHKGIQKVDIQRVNSVLKLGIVLQLILIQAFDHVGHAVSVTCLLLRGDIAIVTHLRG